MIGVFDSSPIIFLVKLDLLDEVLSLFSKSYIPQLVVKEIKTKRDKANVVVSRLLRDKKLIEAKGHNQRLFSALTEKLGKGEAESILIAIENDDVDLVILDDNVARKTALDFKLRVKGTLGLIKGLYDIHRLSHDVDELYKNLVEIDFRVRKEIFKEIFKDHVK